jgi:hypothetical protein
MMKKKLSPLLVLRERAEARAYLWQCCEYESFQAAVGPLITYAMRHKIKDDVAGAIIGAAFKENEKQ